jgi:predicted nucleotidyltransferase
MNPDQLAEVWGMLDREHLASIARKGPAPVFATISGAHLYGFASPDSDVDLRGAFLLPARALLGMHPPEETISVEDKSTIDLDWVAHDVRKFARLLTNHNGYVLEQLYSPLVVVSTPAHQELMELGKGCVTRPTARHYQGFARGRRKRLAEPEPTVKHLLYAYRVLLTGIYMMQTGEVVANIAVLNERFCVAAIDELVARKRGGAEKMPLDERDLALHGALLDDLQARLDDAQGRSELPEEPTTVTALDAFVVRLRLDAARADPR